MNKNIIIYASLISHLLGGQYFLYPLYMDDPDDLDEAVDAAVCTQTRYELSDRKLKEANLAEQVEQLQAQLAELTVNHINSFQNYQDNWVQNVN